MELATAALGSLLPKLGNLLSDQYKLHKGVRGEIRFLQAEMESMQAVLNMLSKLPPHQITELDKIWVRDLKELSYDIEDSVDTFMVHIDAPLRDKPRSFFRRFFDKTMGLLTKAKTRHRVANDIEDIKKRIREVADRRERYKSGVVSARPDDMATVDPRVLACFEHAANLVGTDVPVEKISNILAGVTRVHKEKRMVVSIVGVGGLGKTTIANLVYERLGGQFDCRAFVSVSLRPNMMEVLSSILRQISKGMYTNGVEMQFGELVRNIKEFLKDKRYFIVIDDVWSEEAWKTIEGALIDNHLGSRVIVTTRNIDVAKYSSVDGAMYELDPLSHEVSKRLLSKRIFNEEEGIPSYLEEVTTKILEKCGGIPLAIITIASMLANLPNEAKWYSVYKSMGCGLEKDKSLATMREILHLSYEDLSSHLKPCLLCLSMFPEDYEIPRKELVRLWVAEGFVDDGQSGGNLYELGERYFNELVNRSMIQPVDIDIYGAVRACRVHDMILDLIISLSAQENFVTISEGPHLISPAGKIRRLSLQGREVVSNGGDDVEEKVILPATTNVSHVRTLIAFGDGFEWMPPLSSFTVIHVLVLKYFPNRNNNLKGLGSLLHLRYLKLLGSDIETEQLEEIGNLSHLKTLDLMDTDITELPASIVQLRQLECLIISDNVNCQCRIGNLVSLQHLEKLDARESLMAELGNLTRLRVLSVYGLSAYTNGDECYVRTFLRSLSNLHNIHTLNMVECSLNCSRIPDQWSGPTRLQHFSGLYISEVPRWLSSLSGLSRVDIDVVTLRQDDLQLLGALPVLRELCLSVQSGGTAEEERLVIGSDGPFHALTYFEFEHQHTCWLVFARGVMPKLQRLELCFKVAPRAGGGIDVGLENLTSLRQVEVGVDCYDARIADVENAERKYRDAFDKHPNHPTLVLLRIGESKLRCQDR